MEKSQIWQKSRKELIWIDNKSYIDFTSGVITANVGHGNPRVIKSVKQALKKGMLHCYKYNYKAKADFQKKILEFTDGIFNQVHYGVSGCDIVETALRIAMRSLGNIAHPLVASFTNSFHGKTLGAAYLSDIKRYQQHALIEGLTWKLKLEYPDSPVSAENAFQILEKKQKQLAAIFIEGIQGSTLKEIDHVFIKKLNELTSHSQILLIMDEIQTGFYRVGEKFCYLKAGITPDIVCLGKGLTSSLPLSLLLLNERAARHYQPGLDSITHMANPVSIAAANACLDIYQEPGFISKLKTSELQFSNGILRLRDKFAKSIKVHYSSGLIGGIEFLHSLSTEKKQSFLDSCFNDGLFISHPVGPKETIFKFTPPLIISEKKLKKAFFIIEKNLDYAII